MHNHEAWVMRMTSICSTVDLVTYITRFQWDMAKYPIKQSLKNISEIISKVKDSCDPVVVIIHQMFCAENDPRGSNDCICLYSYIIYLS